MTEQKRRGGIRPGTDLGGLHTLNDLKQRCLRPNSGHWLWGGATRENGVPCARVPGRTNARGMAITAHLMGRQKESPEQRWYAACGVINCLAPDHLAVGTHADAIASAKAAGRLVRGHATRARIARTLCARSGAVADELVAWARESDQPSPEVAHALGVALSTVKNWRLNNRRASSGMFSQLLAR